jgi:hypothetical protein
MKTDKVLRRWLRLLLQWRAVTFPDSYIPTGIWYLISASRVCTQISA